MMCRHEVVGGRLAEAACVDERGGCGEGAHTIAGEVGDEGGGERQP